MAKFHAPAAALPFNPHVNPLFRVWAASPTYRTEG